MDAPYHSMLGPVERREDRLILRIPMDAGGDKLQLVAETTSFVEGDDLVVPLPEWLAQRMKISEGSEVYVDDRWGKLNISLVN